MRRLLTIEMTGARESTLTRECGLFARPARNREVAGSNPASATEKVTEPRRSVRRGLLLVWQRSATTLRARGSACSLLSPHDR